MDTKEKLSKLDVYFFPKSIGHGNTGQLKTFLHFLKMHSEITDWRFSFVDSSPNLLANMTLKENILLDSIPNELKASKEFDLKNYVESLGNQYLSELFDGIKLLEEKPIGADTQTLKLVEIVKGFLQQKDYLLLNSPEKYLDTKASSLLLKAIDFHASATGQIFFISSEDSLFWESFATKKVTRRADRKFEIQKVIHSKQKTKNNENDLQGHLKIHTASDQDKNAA